MRQLDFIIISQPLKEATSDLVINIKCCINGAYMMPPKKFLQYHRGRRTQSEVWVLGMVDTSQSPSLGYMEIVPSRDTLTLRNVIQAHVNPGTVVHTDQWAAYNSLGSLPAVSSHMTVNHSVCFVDPATGVHTQNVESYWNRVKTKLKRMKGCDSQQLSSYLDEFMWRERHGRNATAAYDAILGDISAQYPV